MKLLTVVFAAMFAASVFADGVRYPIQDTYVSNVERDAGYGKIGWYLIGNGAEACVMFPVSGLANVTSAKFKFYVSQRGSDPSIKYPLYIRVMRDDRWHHDMLTWNALPDEFRFGHPSLLDVGKDPSIAGYIEVPGGEGGVFQEVDITKAVKDAAHSGRLALHIFTSWKPSGSDNLTLAMKSLECEDVSLRPCITFTGNVDTSDATMTVVASADTHIEGGKAGTNFGGANDAVMADRDGREAFVKFDLSGVKVDHVDSAMLLLYTYPSTYQPTLDDHVYTSDDGIQFQLTEKTDWDEMSLTWSNAEGQTGCTPGLEKKVYDLQNGYDWQSNVPANAVRGPSSATDKFYRIDVAKLVNQVLAVGGKTLSLRIIRNPEDSKRYFFFCPREYPNEAHRPRLLVTPKVDAALVARKPLHDTFVGNSAADKVYYNWKGWKYLQVGYDGKNMQYGLMQFDPSGLEGADFVRLRIQSRSILPECEGALRVTAWQTDCWNATNLTWSTLSPWFPQPTAVVQGTALDGEIASLKPTQTRAESYIELDVTAVVKSAAKAGKYVTFGLFSNAGTWPEIYRGESDHPAALLFPGIVEGFGKRVTCSLDLEGEKPALRLTWSPSASADATYTVERKDGENYETVACDLTSATCIDPDAEPWTDYSYRITESASSESVVKTVKLEAVVNVTACADTYVQNGALRTSSFGTKDTLIHKYEAAENLSVREGLYRFDISECPYDFKSATLKLYAMGEGGHSGNEKFWVLTYPDFEWTDDTAPTWNSVFNNGYATPMALARGGDGVRIEANIVEVCDVNSPLGDGRFLEFDVSSIIRKAKANNQTHITLHTCAEDPDNAWNFDIISRERAQGVSWGPQIEFKLRSWIDRGFQIIIK